MKKKLKFYSTIGFAILQALATATGQGQKQASSVPPSDIENKINSILHEMTLEEKIDLLGGTDGFLCPGYSALEFKTAQNGGWSDRSPQFWTGNGDGRWHRVSCHLESSAR